MNAEIIIIGAGSAGLMAARELAKAGKEVLILEARDRIGGRILPLSEIDFGYPAQGGAEWVHGEAPITRKLMKEAGLTLAPDAGEVWSARNGTLILMEQFIQSNESLKEKLSALKEDLPIADFLDRYFSEEKDADFRNSVLKAVEGYEAADPKRMSTFALRDSWLTKSEWDDGRIAEGYGPLVEFLEQECKKYGVEIFLNTQVTKITLNEGGSDSDRKNSVSIFSSDGTEYRAQKVIVTVPVPVLRDIVFDLNNSEFASSTFAPKLEAVSKIGFGNAIKILIKFKTRWWEHGLGKDLSKMSFLLCNEKFLTWWTQYPEINTVLSAWMAGPEAAKHAGASSEELLDLALVSLSNVFGVAADVLKKEIVISQVMNWPGDQFSKGAYSYRAVGAENAQAELAQPIGNSIFFAGEALCSGDGRSTVEGALSSSLEAVRGILERTE